MAVVARRMERECYVCGCHEYSERLERRCCVHGCHVYSKRLLFGDELDCPTTRKMMIMKR